MYNIWLVSILLLGSLSAESMRLYPFSRHGKYGFLDENGVVRIPAHYDGASSFSEGLAPAGIVSGEVVYKEGVAGPNCFVQAVKWGFINSSEKIVIPFRYSEVKPFSEGAAAVRIGAMWGFVNTTGQLIAGPIFSEAHSFEEGLARVRLKATNKVGYIDKSGELVIPPKFDEGTEFRGGIAQVVVQNHEKRFEALIDRTGRVVTEKARLYLLGEGLAAFRDEEEYEKPLGLVDLEGHVIVKPEYEVINTFSESVAAVKKNGKWGFVGTKGQVVIPIAFADSGGYHSNEYGFHEGLSKVYVGGRFGYINHSGSVAIPPRFVDAEPFSEGVASACVATNFVPSHPYEARDQRCGFIDKTGEFVITPRFRHAEPFKDQIAIVGDPNFGSEMRINRKGKVIDRINWSDQPYFEPHGECQLSPPPSPAPPPPDYTVQVALKTVPDGASVYLIPLWDWQENSDGALLLADPDALASYLVPHGTTPLDRVRLKAQVYMAIFEIQNKRKIAKLVVAENSAKQLSVSF